MIAASAFAILQVGGVVLLAVGSGLVWHVMRLAESEAERVAPLKPTPARTAPVQESLSKAA